MSNLRGNVTEWKVKIASLVSFLGSLAAAALLETRGVDIINDLPEPARIVLLPLLVAAATWFSGRAARSRPDQLSPSTVEAVKTHLRRRGDTA